MNPAARVTIAVLAFAVVMLAVALVVALHDDDDDDSTLAGMPGSGPYMGMMQAMGGMDSDAMLAQMRGALGDDAYEQMMQHFQNHHSSGPMTDDPGIDEMMHRMMDGMMQQMPSDSDGTLPLPEE